MEKGPEFRTVGGASQEKKEEVKKKLREALFNHFESLSPEERKEVAKFEYNKSDKENGLIDFANQETNRLRQEAGLEPYEIPHENYHLLPSKEYEKIYKKIYKETGSVDHVGTVLYARQGIIIDAEKLKVPLNLGAVLSHETLHMKGHFAVELEEHDRKTRRTIFRTGVSVHGMQRKEPHGHFSGLNEAIVATQEKKSFPKMLDSPLLKEEKEWLASDEAKKIKKEIARGRKMPEDEFMWVGKEKGWAMFSYFSHRQVLDYVCTEIQKEYLQQYQNKDEVFNEFLKSHFTGRLLPIARLVEKTFGEGGFRALSDMSAQEESAVLHMELLRKARVRQLKKEKIQ